MKAKTKEERVEILKRLGATFYKLRKELHISSIRGLASDIGMENTHLQNILKGEVNIGFTLLISIIEGLKIDTRHFFEVYDGITEADIRLFEESLKRSSEKQE